MLETAGQESDATCLPTNAAVGVEVSAAFVVGQASGDLLLRSCHNLGSVERSEADHPIGILVSELAAVPAEVHCTQVVRLRSRSSPWSVLLAPDADRPSGEAELPPPPVVPRRDVRRREFSPG